MAEEDVVFGKNRHLFGGIEPSNMSAFSARQEISGTATNVILSAILPANTTIGDQTLCTVAGAVIRRKAGSAPANEFDGDLVANITTSGEVTDPNEVATDTTYYYQAFPYTTQGVYNRNKANLIEVEVNDLPVPDNMRKFEVDGNQFNAITGVPFIKISYIWPADGTVSPVGITIVRRSDRYPTSETDGTVVLTDTSNPGNVEKTFNDTTASPSTTYYYQAFPYGADGFYNRNPINRATTTVSPMHPPKPTLVSLETGKTKEPQVKITVSFGTDQTWYTTKKIVVKRKLATGDDSFMLVGEILKSSSDYTLTDTNVTDNTKYLYQIHAEFENGVTSATDSGEATVSTMWVFGVGILVQQNPVVTYQINPPDTLPDTYTDFGVQYFDNKDFTPATSQEIPVEPFPSFQLDMGSWDFQPGEYFAPRPCMLRHDGTVAYYLDPNDYTKKLDDTASDVTDPSVNLEVMLEFPKIYMASGFTNNINGSTLKAFAISNVKVNDNYDCWCNYDKDGNEIDYFYISAYAASYAEEIIDGESIYKWRSLSGRNAASPTLPLTNFYENIRSRLGEDWDGLSLSEVNLIQTLAIMVTKRLDVNNVFGVGITNPTGKCDDLPYNSVRYTINNDSSKSKYTFKFFGLESLWTVSGYPIVGAYAVRDTSDSSFNRYFPYGKLTRSTKDGTTSSDWPLTNITKSDMLEYYNQYSPGMPLSACFIAFKKSNLSGTYCYGLDLFLWPKNKKWGFFPILDEKLATSTTYLQSPSYYIAQGVKDTSVIRMLGNAVTNFSIFGMTVPNAYSTQGPYRLTCHPSKKT